MIATWEQAVHALNQIDDHEQPHIEWMNLLEILGLSADGQAARMDALEGYLDRNDAFLEGWAERSGA
jgi:hypothetical protein